MAKLADLVVTVNVLVPRIARLYTRCGCSKVMIVNEPLPEQIQVPISVLEPYYPGPTPVLIEVPVRSFVRDRGAHELVYREV